MKNRAATRAANASARAYIHSWSPVPATAVLANTSPRVTAKLPMPPATDRCRDRREQRRDAARDNRRLRTTLGQPHVPKAWASHTVGKRVGRGWVPAIAASARQHPCAHAPTADTPHGPYASAWASSNTYGPLYNMCPTRPITHQALHRGQSHAAYCNAVRGAAIHPCLVVGHQVHKGGDGTQQGLRHEGAAVAVPQGLMGCVRVRLPHCGPHDHTKKD
jgi:hypothetical protein